MRNKLKEFIVERDLKISFLHRITGIHKVTLSKLIKTNAPIKPFVLLKLEAKLGEIGFSRLDMETFKRLVSLDFCTNCEDGEVFYIESRYSNNYTEFKLSEIASIDYSPTESVNLFCEVLFKNKTRLILKNKDIGVFI